MEINRLLKLAGVQITEHQQTDAYNNAVSAVSTYLAEVMNQMAIDTSGDFGGSTQPKDILQYILRRISKGVAVSYKKNA